MIAAGKSFRQKLIATVTFLGGIYFFLEFFLPKNVGGFQFDKYHEEISNGFILLGAVAIGLGIINLVRVHGVNILKGRRGWYNSVALILGLLVTFAIEISDFLSSEARSAELAKINSLAKYTQSVKEQEQEPKVKAERVKALSETLESLSGKIADKEYPVSASYLRELPESEELASSLEEKLSSVQKASDQLTKSLEAGQGSEKQFDQLTASIKTLFQTAHESSEARYQSLWPRKSARFLFEALYAPLGAAMFSLLAFYVATAAYRSFRIHSAEAAIMMFAALIVVLGQIPFGPLYISEHLPAMREWLMENLSNPAFRAILFGSLIAGLGMAMRMWLSLEKSPLDAEGDS